MATPLEYITVRYPPYLVESNLDELIAMAEVEVGESYCNEELRNKAVALLTMHWIALAKRDPSSGTSASGSITSEKEGDLARSYGSISKSSSSTWDNPYLMSTNWGMELLQLQAQCIMTITNRCI